MTSLPTLADDNLHLHMRWVQERTAGMHVLLGDDLLVVDSGLPTDTFNFISRARLDARQAAGRIAESLAYFDAVNRPFSWWVGLTDEPVGLVEMLEQAGLRRTEAGLAMATDLAELRPARLDPDGLRIARVSTGSQLDAYARLLSALWSPPDENVIEFYRRAGPVLLAAECPMRLYLGTLDSTPVATAEMTLSEDTAGLYNISAAADVRGRGIGSAMTSFPLLEAGRTGYRLAVLQAAADAVGIYRRLGFRDLGRYTEYQR